ncbi:hypothetical protein [Streptomyces sp. ODS28]|uniref:hypothetical protein n=1 Tax=Streptomyces sp. ODS28 TaxID=3136688 RepID=UPI0031E87A0F
MFSPAGFDTALRGTLEEVRAGRWMSMRTLLRTTGRDWALRTSRSQVLGIVAAHSQVVQAWLDEVPGDPDGLLMRARVGVERALRAHRERHPSAGELEEGARRACLAAAEALPADPVPWVCLLALAQADTGLRRPEHRQQAAEPMLPTGPWGLLYRVRQRDGYNREAHHRMLQFLNARAADSDGSQAASIDFIRWVVSWAPAGSPLLVLPLYAYAEQFRRHDSAHSADRWLRRRWADEPVMVDTRNALYGWFDRTDPTRESVLDLNYLAHAAWSAHWYKDAARVFTALGPYYTRQPWTYVSDGPGDPEAAKTEFLRARAQSLAATG